MSKVEKQNRRLKSVRHIFSVFYFLWLLAFHASRAFGVSIMLLDSDVASQSIELSKSASKVGIFHLSSY